jgi:hypothetical protein
MIWNAWVIIYAIMSQLLTIMSANSLTSIFSAQSFGGAFQGASQMLLISMSSILLSIMILLIPFMAKRIISGEVGSTMLIVAGVAATTVQNAIAGWAGVQGGAASAVAGGGQGGGGASGTSAIQASGTSSRAPIAPAEGGTSGAGAGASAQAPAPPTDSSAPTAQPSGGHRNRAGAFRPHNIPHAVGWTVGTWAGSAYRGVRRQPAPVHNEGEEI